MQQEVEAEKDIKTLADYLQLPDKYELICTFQQSFDSSLNLLHMRQETPTYARLKSMIQNSTKREFNMQHVQQIFGIVPSFYNHHWELRQNKMELVI